jgi:hypothetical protein
MDAWREYREYLASVKVSPGDIIDSNGLPWILDLDHRPPGYRYGTYRCQPCGRDPYDPRCCRQWPPCYVCGRPVHWRGGMWMASDETIACRQAEGPRLPSLPPVPPFVPHKVRQWT